MIAEQDKNTLEQKGITEDMLKKQLTFFRDGFPYLKISSVATVDDGIFRLNNEEQTYLDVWDSYLSLDKKIVKFVPASGAASRMFKDLFEFLSADYEQPTTDFEITFFENLPKFAFYARLDGVCLKKVGKDIKTLLTENKYKTIVEYLLKEEGLNYGNLPKGLLEFHKKEEGVATPLEEQLHEGYLYARNNKNEVDVHFTVSPEHRALFLSLANEKKIALESKFDVNYNITFSEQKPSTDTVAVDLNNELFRDEAGELVFRPGGHGALIENLNDLDADVIFIKNIDNVVPARLKAFEAKYKKILGGVLVSAQKKIFEYLKLIDSTKYTHDDLVEMLHFVQRIFHVRYPETKLLEDAELILYIKRKLDRPCRVCGMVKNVGEPGGGPFIVYNPDGTVSPQILESSQIDLANPQMKALFESGTHFNPVDIVCSLKDYAGRKFNLKDFVDEQAGFISKKSKDGKELKALELPGLWNGAMSDWNTLFVEIPIDVFNPVKNINDLLRPNHLFE